jgi:membrane-bound ClpP family serine protease
MVYLKLLLAITKARGRKRRPSLPKVSSVAIVNTDLKPHGSVLAGGELWQAETLRGNSINRQEPVTIVGFRDHLLLVEERS